MDEIIAAESIPAAGRDGEAGLEELGGGPV